jgi:hypothetical protein
LFIRALGGILVPSARWLIYLSVKILSISITEQKDRIFAGNITYKVDNESISQEGFAGAIGLDGKTLYLSEFDGGYSFGTLISSDEMELIYLEDGEDGAVAIDKVFRIKE